MVVANLVTIYHCLLNNNLTPFFKDVITLLKLSSSHNTDALMLYTDALMLYANDWYNNYYMISAITCNYAHKYMGVSDQLQESQLKVINYMII